MMLLAKIHETPAKAPRNSTSCGAVSFAAKVSRQKLDAGTAKETTELMPEGIERTLHPQGCTVNHGFNYKRKHPRTQERSARIRSRDFSAAAYSAWGMGRRGHPNPKRKRDYLNAVKGIKPLESAPNLELSL